jgi:hypothetical protein
MSPFVIGVCSPRFASQQALSHLDQLPIKAIKAIPVRGCDHENSARFQAPIKFAKDGFESWYMLYHLRA